MVIRCAWAGGDPLMQAYHDEEWGVPVRDFADAVGDADAGGVPGGPLLDRHPRKREAFRAAFAGFDPEKVARFGAADVARLMADPGIVRARAKIEATIRGAQISCEMAARGEDFADYCWSFTGGEVLKGDGKTLPAKTELSETISKDMKGRGFKFVGPTIVYAWMQAVGIVDDHMAGCFRRS